jgi:hypothetical protein
MENQAGAAARNFRAEVAAVIDEMRPLLHYLPHEKRGHVPTILVRAVPVSLGTTQEAEIRKSYRILWVPTLP